MGEQSEIAPLRERIAKALAAWVMTDGEWDISTYNGADAVLDALNITVVCSCCGLSEADCSGLDYWGDAHHEYEPLAYIQLEHVGRTP